MHGSPPSPPVRASRLAPALAALFSLALLFAPAAAAQDAPRLGVYDTQRVLQAFGPYAEYQQKVRDLQARARQQGQGLDQETLMKMRQQMNAARNELLQEYQRAVNDALPGVARQNDLQVVAVEVAYTSDNVETVDVTGDLVEALNGAAGASAGAPAAAPPAANRGRPSPPQRR